MHKDFYKVTVRIYISLCSVFLIREHDIISCFLSCYVVTHSCFEDFFKVHQVSILEFVKPSPLGLENEDSYSFYILSNITVKILMHIAFLIVL